MNHGPRLGSRRLGPAPPRSAMSRPNAVGASGRERPTMRPRAWKDPARERIQACVLRARAARTTPTSRAERMVTADVETSGGGGGVAPGGGQQANRWRVLAGALTEQAHAPTGYALSSQTAANDPPGWPGKAGGAGGGATTPRRASAAKPSKKTTPDAGGRPAAAAAGPGQPAPLAPSWPGPLTPPAEPK